MDKPIISVQIYTGLPYKYPSPAQAYYLIYAKTLLDLKSVTVYTQ